MPQRGNQFAALLREIKRAGLLDRHTRYYVWTIAGTAALLSAGWTAFALIGDSWWQLAVAVLLAVAFPQVLSLIHI